MLREIADHCQAIWLLLKYEGKHTPRELRVKTGKPERTVFRILSELAVGGFAVKLDFGVYGAVDPATGGRVPATDDIPPATGGRNPAIGGSYATGGRVETATGGRNPATGGIPGEQQLTKLTKLNKTKQNKEIFENLKTAESLLAMTDIESVAFVDYRTLVGRLFHEEKVSLELLDRIAAGCIEGVFGISETEIENTLELIRKQSVEAQAENRVKFRWMAVANMVQRCFEQRGFAWTPCQSNFELARGGHKEAVALQIAEAQAKKAAKAVSERKSAVAALEKSAKLAMAGNPKGEDLIRARIAYFGFQLQVLDLKKSEMSDHEYERCRKNLVDTIETETGKLSVDPPEKVLKPGGVASRLQSAAGKRSGEVRRAKKVG